MRNTSLELLVATVHKVVHHGDMSMEQQTQHDPRLEFDMADRMRRALRVSGISVEEIAGYLGVTRGAVSTWINGRIVPRTSTVRLFALRTGFPYEWIATGAETGTPTSPVGPAGIEPTTSTVKAGRLVALPSRGAPKMRELAVAS